MTTNTKNPAKLAFKTVFELEPLIDEIRDYAEILMAAGTSPLADITPGSIHRIGGNIRTAAVAALQIIAASSGAEADDELQRLTEQAEGVGAG